MATRLSQLPTPDPSRGRPMSGHLEQRREFSPLVCLRLRINFVVPIGPTLPVEGSRGSSTPPGPVGRWAKTRSAWHSADHLRRGNQGPEGVGAKGRLSR